jgi:two-component system, NtrC family, sensor kinase
MADDAARIEQLETELRRVHELYAVEVASLQEQRTATAEVLRVIASSPTDLQLVLETIAQAAQRLCGGDWASVQQRNGDYLRSVAYGGDPEVIRDRRERVDRLLPGRPGTTLEARASVTTRAFMDQTTVHVPDTDLVADDLPETYLLSHLPDVGWRAQVAAPLIRGDASVGTLMLFRREPGPFSNDQIRRLETFADQAAIAIENARLFQELEQRNAELQESNRQVTEALAGS